jgi:hypothetical protein
LPFKANAARRHHIPKQKHRVTNWAEYDAALRARGSLTVWFTPEAVAAWAAAPRISPGGQPTYFYGAGQAPQFFFERYGRTPSRLLAKRRRSSPAKPAWSCS